MNGPRYDDDINDNTDNPSIYSDPKAMFEMMGMGTPGGLPMPSFLTAPNVRSRSRVLSSSIFDSWNTLHVIIEHHEETIRKRWLKKTREQRKRILNAVWPGMATSHRPDIDQFKRKRNSQEAYKWPSINTDDLSKPKLFLLFLSARARNQPFAFARADINACRFGITSRALIPGFLNEHVMMFTGRTSSNTYGELIAWEDHPDAFDWLTSQRGAHPGEGLLILEIQDRLYRFLVDCCKNILQDMTEAVQIGAGAPPQPEPPSLMNNDLGLTSLATSTAEAPYRVPAELNLQRLESIIQAKVSDAEDHIWALREDPGYFASILQEYRDHRQELMVDTNGKRHPLLATPTQEHVFWGRVIQNSIVAPLAEMEIWGVLLDKVIDLRRLQIKYAAEIDPERDLPPDYAFAFYTFYHHLQNYVKGPIGVLKHGFVASPPMRSYFDREPQDPGSTIIRIVSRARPRGEAEMIIWVMTTLFDEQQLHLVGLNTLMDELERIQTEDAKAKKLISSWVTEKIADLAVLSHCQHQVELYQPWAASFETEMAGNQESIEKDLQRTQKSFEKYFTTELDRSLISLGTPHNGRFRYPADKRRTRENIEAMQQAEKNLDEFWCKLDRKLASVYALSPRVRSLLSQRVLERTPDWVEPIKPTKPAETQVSSSEVKPLATSLSNLRFDPEQRSEHAIGRDDLQSTKTKIKTRGTSSAQVSSFSIIAARTQPDSQPLFSVDKRALKVFKSIFHTPSASSLPGEIAWQDFVYSLCSTCFFAEKLYGSVWHFTPRGLDVERGIHFHEPHPGGKIPFLTARRHGRRLNRAYGWHGGMFVLGSSQVEHQDSETNL